MKMQLVSLKLENFKCHEHLEIRFDGQNANIYGENAAGKSSIYDGLTWLLFGKDSHGKKDFDIKPLTLEGDVKDHAAITSVEAVLLVDGMERKLKRTYYEVWSTKRGSAEATFDGHSSDYFVDDVPCKKNEFSHRVGEIINENAFRLLTSITYFAEGLPFQDRRAILFDVAAVATDEEILASDARFAPLAEALGKMALEDYKKILLARRKALNGVRSDTPARLDECKKTVEELSGIDFDALERKKQEVLERRDRARRELDEAGRDAEQEQLRGRLNDLRGAMDRLEAENAAHRRSQQEDGARAKADGLRNRLSVLQAIDTRRRRDLEYLRRRETELENDVAVCRANWDTANAEQFRGGACPTCGQPLPPDKLKEAKDAFERGKEERKAQEVERAKRTKEQLARVQEDVAKLEKEEARDRKDAGELEETLKALESAKQAEITDLADYASRKAELEDQVKELEAELKVLSGRAALRRQGLRGALEDADREIGLLSGELARKTALEYAHRRIEELRAQAAAAAKELDRLDGMLYLCEEFMRYKVSFIEESVNRRFSLVRFRLFREQINGGLEDCCDVTVGGVPYASGLNSGARVNAGIDIINTLSRHYGAWVPLFVDNAESVTRLERADTQVIRLVVSERDKELRCELTDGGLH